MTTSTPNEPGNSDQDDTLPITLGKGVANRMAETKVPDGFARIAQNVDISSDEVISQRDGYTLVEALANAHSIWSDPQLDFALLGDANTLYRMSADETIAALFTGIKGAEIDYCMTPLGVYCSDGAVAKRVHVDGSVSDWGVETPKVAAAVAATGSLDAGTYAVTAKYVNASGEESGAPESQYVDVPAGGGILVTPSVPLASGIDEARIYATTANGQELQYVGSTVPGTAFSVGAGARGRPLRTQYLHPLPPLRYPCIKHGRLLGASGRRLIWSEPMYYGLHKPTTNFISLRGQTITMVAASDTSTFLVYVGTDTRTYKWEGNSIEDATLAVISHFGVIPGSMARVSPDAIKLDGIVDPVPVWVDKRGIPYAGTPGGAVQIHDKFAYPIFGAAAAVFDQRDGNSRYLVSGRGGKPSGLTVGDYVTATVTDCGGGL